MHSLNLPASAVTSAVPFQAMQLRDHPALACFGFAAWPPVWSHAGAKPNKRLMGEIGVFTGSLFHDQTPKRLFIRMEFQGDKYLGRLVVSDWSICRTLHRFLKDHVGKEIREIGSLDVSHSL